MAASYIFLRTMITAAAMCGCQASATDPVLRQAGKWKITQTTISYSPPAWLSAEQRAQVMDIVGKPNVEEMCLSGDEAAQDTPEIRVAGAIGFVEPWTVDHLQVTNGEADLTATIHDPADGTGKISVKGKITPTTTTLVQTMEGTDNKKGHTAYELHYDAERVGECDEEGGT